MICFRNIRVGDRVRQMGGVYEGIEARVMKVKPQGTAFVSHIKVKFDVAEHDLDDISKASLNVSQQRWLSVRSWELVR